LKIGTEEIYARDFSHRIDKFADIILDEEQQQQ